MPPRHVVALLSTLVLAATLASPARGIDAAPCTPAKARLAFIGLEAQAPTNWIIVRPETEKRLAQFKISAPEEDASAEVVVFYFGEGIGGTTAANIERWQGQFIGGKDNPVVPVVDHFLSNGMSVTTAELRGTYARGIGVGPVGTPKPDQILLAAILESPHGNLIIQLHGAAATVSAQKEGFIAFVKSIRPEGI